MKFYRMMKVADDGMPEAGDAFAQLGVRPATPGGRGDVLANNPTDLVQPGDGGMSVALDSPAHLPVNMKPPRNRYPVWEIDSDDLGAGLVAVDARSPHFVIGPDRELTLNELQALLKATRSRWIRV